MRKCLLAMLILMLVILVLILMLLNSNTGYADTDADLPVCIRIMSLCCRCIVPSIKRFYKSKFTTNSTTSVYTLNTFLYNLLLISYERIFRVFCSMLIAKSKTYTASASNVNLRHAKFLEVTSINTFVTDWLRKHIGLINFIAYIDWSTKCISVNSQLQTK